MHASLGVSECMRGVCVGCVCVREKKEQARQRGLNLFWERDFLLPQDVMDGWNETIIMLPGYPFFIITPEKNAMRCLNVLLHG